MQIKRCSKFKVSTLKLLFFAAALAAVAPTLVGCASKTPSANHIWQVGGTATKLGLVQDPISQQYSLGLQRVQIVNTVIPCRVITNAAGEQQFIVPNVVSSYEVAGHSGVFGNVGLTETMATGTNAVGTKLGGDHEPINSGAK